MKAALIGLGMVADTYGDAFANSDIDLTHIWSPTPDRRDGFLTKWPGPQVADVAAIAASDVDFVILATPPNARAQILRTLADAGKPILMEKPVERSLAQATALVDYCDGKVPLGIMLQHRARPILRDMPRDLGPLIMVEANVPWWRPQSYYDAPGRGTYARDGGGVLISQAIHTLDLMLTLTGPVAEVTAMCATTQAHQMEAEDFVTAGLRFENGAVGQMFATTASFPGTGETITLHHRDGSVQLRAGTLTVTTRDGRVQQFGQTASSGAGADPMGFTSDWHRAVIEDFAQAITEGRPPLIPGRAALEVHRLIAALELSGKTGAKTALNDLKTGLTQPQTVQK